MKTKRSVVSVLAVLAPMALPTHSMAYTEGQIIEVTGARMTDCERLGLDVVACNTTSSVFVGDPEGDGYSTVYTQQEWALYAQNFNLIKKADVRCSVNQSFRTVTSTSPPEVRMLAAEAVFRAIPITSRQSLLIDGHVFRVTYADGGTEDYIVINPLFSSATAGNAVNLKPGSGTPVLTTCVIT
jgi:hypothetical protein